MRAHLRTSVSNRAPRCQASGGRVLDRTAFDMLTEAHQCPDCRALADARYAHQRAMTEAKAYLAEITAAIATMEQARSGPHWGHVGDAGRLAEQLRQVADRLLGRGEYA